MRFFVLAASIAAIPTAAFSTLRTGAVSLANPGHNRVASSTQLSSVQKTGDNSLAAVLDFFNPSTLLTNVASPKAAASSGEGVVTAFINALNSQTAPTELLQYFDDNINYIDTAFYNPIIGIDALLKHWLLHTNSSPLSTFREYQIVIDEIASTSNKVCVMYHLTTLDGEEIPDSTHITFYYLSYSGDGSKKIQKVFDVAEPALPKPGDSGLNLLKTVSSLIGDDSIVISDKAVESNNSPNTVSVVERYFDAWNRRDMKTAISLFTPDCQMRDLQYDDAFSGRDEFERHLLRVKDCLPSSFAFVVDDIALTKTKAGVLWHVENNGDPLAFTRGCSFYNINEKSGLIESGFEIPEKAPPKMGYLNTLKSKFEAEPIRFIPAAIWVAYMYILFISDGILPGANALALEQRTWEEVRDLSLNFFLVAPALHLPFSPVVHPMLEGVFNLLLAWAAMFAGFLSDERKDKPNLLPFGPMLVGMQFLTSGFLLPYLFTRTVETNSEVYKEDIDGEIQTVVAEWRPLGGFLGFVGTASIFWGLFARSEFGGFSERYASFGDLLSIDRVGSSFIVDLVIFAAFQSWFVDDDLKRRDIDKDDLKVLRGVAKYLPFFGLAAYLSVRPPLPSRESIDM
jgi:ketosteroid isomerase-like protein